MYREIPRFKASEILVYLRKSRSDDPSLTLEEVLEMHEAKLKGWIERNLDEPIPPENWFREVVSGETIQDRVEFQKILKLIESPKYKAVLVVESERLSRGDLMDCGLIIRMMRYTETYVITLNRVYDLRDEFDREGFERELKHGNYYLEYSKKLMKRGIDYVVQLGGYVASIPPYGYKKVRVLVGKRKIPTLEIVEEQAEVVRMMFRWYLDENLGCQRIADRLDQLSIKPMKAQHWGSQSVRKILENEHYIGKIRYYAHEMIHVVNDLNVTKKRVAKEDYQLFDGLHEAIIDEETFELAKSKRDKFPRVKKDRKMRNPLSSLLYCECGYAMTYVIRRGVPRFECTEARRCGNASVDAQFIIDSVCDVLRKNIEDISVDIGKSNIDEISRQEEIINALEKKLGDIEYKELSLWEKYTEEQMPRSVFENLKKKYESERESTQKALETARKELPKKIDYEERIATFHGALDYMTNDNISAEAKNSLLKECIEKIVFSRPKGVRVPKEEQKEGETYVRGWLQGEATLDITLKL